MLSAKRRLFPSSDEDSTSDHLSVSEEDSPPEDNAIVINGESTSSTLFSEYRKVQAILKQNKVYKLPELVIDGSANPVHISEIPNYFSSIIFRHEANANHAQALPKHITAVDLRNTDLNICDGIKETVKEVEYRGANLSLKKCLSTFLSKRAEKRNTDEELEDQPVNKKPRF